MKNRLWIKRIVGLIVAMFVVLCIFVYWTRHSIPGRSYNGPLPPLGSAQQLIQTELRKHLTQLSKKIGARHVGAMQNMRRAEHYIHNTFQRLGYKVRKVGFPMNKRAAKGKQKWVYNIEATQPGHTHNKELLVIGAHYDTVPGCPGANDNTSGIAGVLVLAKQLRQHTSNITLRFVGFANEEPPYFRSSKMGSLYYARTVEGKKEKIKGMISLETIGYFSDKPGSQRYPFPLGLFYPSKGNFIGFVSNFSSRSFLHQNIRLFRQHAKIPSEGAATFSELPGVGWSDHWSFWQAGYPAIMVTDTAPYRYPHYHKQTDTVDKLKLRHMTWVIDGLMSMIRKWTK
tara:strand:- start:2397 stop:3422 length:1026 start_codon:yes stop_codon:yes gene_type:complete